MKLKITLLLITALVTLGAYAQDRIQLKNGELLGYITLVNDSVLKFKVNKEDKSEYTLKRKEVLSYAYAEPLIDTTGYKHLYIIKSNRDTLMRYAVGDGITYQLMGQCEEPAQGGRITKIQKDRIEVYMPYAGNKYSKAELLLFNVCYIAKPDKNKILIATLLRSTIGHPAGWVGPTNFKMDKFHQMDEGIKFVIGN